MNNLEKKVERVLQDIKDILAVPMETLDGPTGFRINFSTPQTRLWSVLTALRGPDTGDTELKSATTAVIRHAIGMRESRNAGGAVVSPDSKAALAARQRYPLSHFIAHAQHAFEALGLKWDEVN